MKRLFFLLYFSFLFFSSFSQYKSNLPENAWVDSVFKTLSNDEKISQLIVIRAFSNPADVSKTAELISKYNVGALCFFQGGPIRQAMATNYFQSLSKTPLMVTIDGEWGLGMRLDSVNKFPYQLTLGALSDPSLIYQMGIAVGEQCKRIGVHVNFAPVVDVNNNPNNPVIGYRSFGEDKNKVALFGLAYMKGMQDAGIMACAKHFPGHGDVDVDSHLDLPVIKKTKQQLDTLELQPFKTLFNAGVGSVMIAHLYIPAIDSTPNKATSLSKNNVTGLLRNDLGYNGLTFTDALEMKGVAKYWPGGEAAVQALIAGNDMLCLPESVPEAIDATKKAIEENRLSWNDIDTKLQKVLHAKFKLGLNAWKPVDTTNLVNDLNVKTDDLRERIARKTITVLKNQNGIFLPENKKLACVSIGTMQANSFANRMKQDRNADVYLFSYKDSTTKEDSILQAIRNGHYNNVVVTVSNYSLRPANTYNISSAAIDLFNQLQVFNTTNLVFGNVFATDLFCGAKNLVACYQDDSITHQIAADLLESKIGTEGKLPVSVCDLKFGEGISLKKPKPEKYIFYQVDSIAMDALQKKAFPGCVIYAMHEGKVVYEKAFGRFEYSPTSLPMTPETIFDLASVTKISATTLAVMKLYEEGTLQLDKTLGDYLPWTKDSDKAGLKIEDVLLHQAGLTPFIPFYKETIDTVTGTPDPKIYSDKEKPGFNIMVAKNLYMRNDWVDTMFQRILKSPLSAPHKYVYSDNDFIFLGKIVEALTGTTLDDYVKKTFYEPMGLTTTGFKPLKRFGLNGIAPTEEEKHFRRQLIWGTVHDEGAAMFGGVAGHAGLFSDADDLAELYQMLLNGGEWNGRRYLKPETIELFTAYHSEVSRRGYGFDKPEKDNTMRRDPYPSSMASPQTFGHTGFTGTCVWVDPKYKIVYVFLSNRVNPTRNNNKISTLLVRGKIQDAIYKALGY